MRDRRRVPIERRRPRQPTARTASGRQPRRAARAGWTSPCEASRRCTRGWTSRRPYRTHCRRAPPLTSRAEPPGIRSALHRPPPPASATFGRAIFRACKFRICSPTGGTRRRRSSPCSARRALRQEQQDTLYSSPAPHGCTPAYRSAVRHRVARSGSAAASRSRQSASSAAGTKLCVT